MNSAGDKIGDLIVNYFCEFEALPVCKTALTRYLVAQVGLFDEKNKRLKISLHWSFREGKDKNKK
jgi:hypothetical protein